MADENKIAPSYLLAGTPSYMVAADIHSMSNGQGSMLSPENWADSAASLGKWSIATAARAVTSTWNIIPTVGNWFGGDFQKADTGDVLRSLDDNLGTYYEEHRASVDLAGDLAASLIPGLGGIGAVRWGQRALALIPEGNAGATLARSIGLLSNTSKAYAAEAVAQVGAAENIFGGINASVAKSFGYAYAQNALEMAAFDVASSLALQDSPLFKDHTAKDIVYNSVLGGGLVGGGIMAGISAVQVKGAMTRATIELDRKLNVYKATTDLSAASLSSNPAASIFAALQDLNNSPALPEVTDTLYSRASQALTSRNAGLWDAVHENTLKLTRGDVGLTQSLVESLKKMDFETQANNIAYLESATRGGFKTSTENVLNSTAFKIKQAQKQLIDITGDDWRELFKAQSDRLTTSLVLRGEDAGAVYSGTPEGLTLADKFKSAGDLHKFVKDQKFKIGDDFDYALAKDTYHAQARNIWADSAPLKAEDKIGAKDIGLLTRGYALNLPYVTLKDGTQIAHENLLEYIHGVKKQAAVDLFEQSKTGMRQASPEALLAKLQNTFGQHIEMMTSEEINSLLNNKSGTVLGFYQMLKSGDQPGMFKVINRTVINREYLERGNFADLVKTLSHEEGHSKTIRYFAATQLDKIPPNELEAMMQEAYKLSVRQRFGSWMQAKKDPEFMAYLSQPTELLADAYSQISRTPSMQNPAKYPMIYKYFGQEIRNIDAVREINLSKRDLSARELSNWLDTSESYINHFAEPEVATEANLLRNLHEAKAELQDKIAAGKVPAATTELPKIYERPSVVKLGYRLPDGHVPPNSHELAGQVYYQQQAALAKDNAYNVMQSIIGVHGDSLPKSIPSQVLSGASRADKGAGFASMANGRVDSALSFAQMIGAAVDAGQQDIRKAVAETFLVHKHVLESRPEIAREIGLIQHTIQTTPEKYVLERVDDKPVGLVLKKVKDHEEALAAFQSGMLKERPVMEVLEDNKVPARINNLSPESLSFLSDWVETNNEWLKKNNLVRQAKGMRTQDFTDVAYFPPPDPRTLKHYAFVQDTSVLGNGHVRMLWAKTPEDLATLAQKTRELGPQYNVFFKNDIEAFKRRLQEYDYDSSLVQQWYDGNMKRTGVAAPFYPVTDGQAVAESLMNYRIRAETNLLRDSVATCYAPEISQLRTFGKEFANVKESRFKGPFDVLKAETGNPFDDTIRTMLNVSVEESSGIWRRVNNLVENSFDGVINRIKDHYTKKATPEALEAVNQEIRKTGLSVGYPDAVVERLANTLEDRKYLRMLVSKSNAVLGSLMLRFDPMQALNNGLGAAVMTAPEISRLLSDIAAGDSVNAGRLAGLKLTVPGTDGKQVLSAGKLIGNAYKDWAAYSLGNLEQASSAGAKTVGELATYFKTNRWMTTLSEQVKDSLSEVVLSDASTQGYKKALSALDSAGTTVGNLLEKYTGNKFAEEMNRFVAAHIMHSIGSIAIDAGKIGADELSPLINTFVNRTQGCYIATQRPGVFQGAVGSAIGLFQTYQFNMMQQLLRHVGDRNLKATLTMMGAQASIYGLHGLPAFDTINQALIGQAAGNTSRADLYTGIYDVAGKEAGDWLLYGLGSNFMLSPDLKVNLYSRGDVNPRQATILPTSLSEVPIVSAYTKMFKSLGEALGKVQNGGDVYSSMLQGIEHMGLSRPLTGIAQAMEALGNGGKVVATSNKGDILGMNDLYSLTTLARIAGAKPLDEAIATDAVYRVRAYNAYQLGKLEDIGAAVKSYVIRGEIPPLEKMNEFAREYAAAGGQMKQFSQFYSRALSSAAHSQVSAIIAKNGSAGSQYMQQILGGLVPQDMINSKPQGE